jgi:pyruvate dehydrogenase E2 component (dihydrolipoamide acetyltransferase)
MDLKLPSLGEGADSGTVVNVFVKEGDQVAKDQPLLELENEKAVATIPSTAAGKVGTVYVKAGDKLSVGQRILTLVEAGAAKPSAPEAPAQHAPGPRRAAPAEELPQPPASQEESLSEPKPGLPPAAAPSLRKLARDLGIDLAKVRGSARGGRILLEDVRAYIQRLQRLAAEPKPAAAPGTPAAAKPEQIDFSKWGPVKKQPLSPLRQVIARRMASSWNAVPRVTQFDQADITRLNELRKKYAPAYQQRGGTKLTLTPFAIKAVVQTLKKYPVLNSSLDEVAQELVLKDYFHIGVAVDTDAGLIVPVIRNADTKSLLVLSKELEDLAGKARERKLAGDALKGGTFTISNQGGIGGAHFTPIINQPEVAILGLGRASLQPVIRENQVQPRLMMPLALSYDHRVIDGGVAARFTVDLIKALEGFAEEDVKLA